jgi:pimeloyl-ACP methyl ester carboxylesterase
MATIRRLAAALGVFALTTAGFSPAQPASATVPGQTDTVKEALTRPAMARAVASVCPRAADPVHCGIESATRQALGNGVAEYTLQLRVGAGVHDLIRLHRVVSENADRSQDEPRRALLMVHGDLWGFDAAFAGQVGRHRRVNNVASFLARSGVDVWGIDLRWVLVPANTTKTGFMHGWGIGTDLADMRLATSVERVVRLLTGDGGGRTALLGWSRGGELAYAYASMESQLPPAERNVSALIPTDTLARYAPADASFRRNLCRAYAQDKIAWESGTDAVTFNDYVTLGRAALTAPDGPSRIIPGYTNRQAALLVSGVADSFNPWYHFLAGRSDTNGVPTSLQYTREQRWYGLMTQAAAFEPLALFLDGAAMWCGTVGSPFGAHLSDVTIPLFYVAAAGGFGTTGLYSTRLVASTDVSSLLVRLHPIGHEAIDYGHVDLWQASNAATLVWRPIAVWLHTH